MVESKEQKNMKRTWISVGVISIVFFAAFFLLRSLPDAQCGFLHYVEIVNENGEIELCATNHAGFLDLTRLQYPVEMSLESEPLVVGEARSIDLFLETSGGMTMAPHDLAITHTEKMHLMVIDPSFEDYHHLHPDAVGLDGRYNFSFTPQASGRYRVLAEVVPVVSRRQAIATAELEVAGEGRQPQFSKSTESIVDGVHFQLENVPQTLKRGKDYRFDLEVSAADGGNVELEMVMDAKGHMVAFDAAGKGFAHMHPMDSIAEAKDALAEDMEGLSFLFNVPNPGWYRVFAQVQINGAAVFGRFDLEVE
ncbi:MAG: hypothetical protein NWT02_04195 [Opitutales bacterium]|jgi:hypothetical protein|nr:hypothetical protein [Opitutales bacterium]MDP4644292.1 hypothetical protein [Opitutales bacterium]MDP4694014.1 hypothetical protein [Opitutales bacterium]MDP4776994.1 hypothetical protein [Opitutales bacterium]MDP4883055.1 hypothetical protein [Opitutales bacterium]